MAGKAPLLHLIAGPNGSGKSTLAAEILRAGRPRLPFVNTDDIARELGDWRRPEVQVAAAKESLARIRRFLAARRSFVHETTLAGHTQINLASQAREDGWEVRLTFVFLRHDATNVARVANRVRLGGHDVPEADIRRRYVRSLENFWRVLHHCDRWAVFDNSDEFYRLVATGTPQGMSIHDHATFRKLEEYRRA
jgi:predicted ABC-type ATPase